jgi:hypothetical protein
MEIRADPERVLNSLHRVTDKERALIIWAGIKKLLIYFNHIKAINGSHR